MSSWKYEATETEREFAHSVLGFFTVTEKIMANNINDRYVHELESLESNYLRGSTIKYYDVYKKLALSLKYIYSVIGDEEEEESYKSIEKLPCVKLLEDWTKKWLNDGLFSEQLVAYVTIKWIFFGCSFASMFWLNHMPGLGCKNQFICYDDDFHSDFLCIMFHHSAQSPPNHQQILDIVQGAVDIEKSFLAQVFPADTLDPMYEYVEFVADNILMKFNMPKYYMTLNSVVDEDLYQFEDL